jgi:hypothetical protein
VWGITQKEQERPEREIIDVTVKPPPLTPSQQAAARKANVLESQIAKLQTEAAHLRRQGRRAELRLRSLSQRTQHVTRELNHLQGHLAPLNKEALTNAVKLAYDTFLLTFPPSNDLKVNFLFLSAQLANVDILRGHVEAQIEAKTAELEEIARQEDELCAELGLDTLELEGTNEEAPE